MRIGEVAKRTGLNISNVRFYERKGLLIPIREEESNYREYSEEDIFRIKEILLYRKMGISVETIYLIQNNQVDRDEILTRQKTELEEQIINLQGAIELCDMVLLEQSIDETQIDRYLEYVHQEEEKGKRFSDVTELLEDFADYTRDEVFYYNPAIVWIFQKSWVARVISICFFSIILAVPVNRIKNVCLGRSEMNMQFWMLLLLYGSMLGGYVLGFWKYRKAKRKYDNENVVYRRDEREPEDS